MTSDPALTASINEEVSGALEGGAPVLVATVVATHEGSVVRVGAKMMLRRDGSRLGALGDAVLEGAVEREAEVVFRRHAVDTLAFGIDGAVLTRPEARRVPAVQVLMEVHERPATLLVIGGGHIGKALATMGEMCGFSVEIVDDRPEYANAERFPEADRITQGRFDEVLADYPIDDNTYVVCVTRGHKHDEVSLKAVVGSRAAYVGMIGSRRRVAAVLQHLLEDGADSEAVGRVHSPIGLDIGAETPAEIAVSIMAEIIMDRRGGTAMPMREAVQRRRGVDASAAGPPA
jgi:xanthine dehydrogenase accessory factor